MTSMDSLSMSATILHIASRYAVYTAFITFFVGIAGNILNLLTFTYLKSFRNNSCAFYLTIESISDIVYLLYNMTLNTIVLLYRNDLTGVSLMWCRLRSTLAQVSGLGTFYMICFAASDQFCLTFYRLNLKPFCTVKVARYVSFIVIGICIIHSIVFSCSYTIIPSVGCGIEDPIFIRYATFFFYPILVGLLPIMLASSFSFMAFRNVRRLVRRQLSIQRRRFDRQITAMVLVRVGFFVCFTLPFVAYRIYTINVVVTKADPLRFSIIQLVQMIIFSILSLNYTANFYIFIATSSRYRRQVKYVVMKKCCKQWRSWFCIRENTVQPENPISIVSANELE